MGRHVTALKRHLVARKIQQRKLAELTGLSKPRISRICGGIGAPPTPEEIGEIVEALQCQPEDVFPFSHLSVLPREDREKEQLCAWIRGAEGTLFLRRLKAIFSDPGAIPTEAPAGAI